MISKLASKATDRLYLSAVIQDEERDLYAYGLFILISNILFFLISVVCGAVLKTLAESIVFFTLFSLLRGYAGGVHASSERKCTVFTTIAIITCNVLIKIMVIIDIKEISIILLCIASVIIVALSPLDTPNKPLLAREKKRYRKISLIVLSTIILIALVAGILEKTNIQYACATSIVLESILLVIGKAKANIQKE